MDQKKEIKTQWKPMIKFLILSLFFYFLWIIYKLELNSFVFSNIFKLNENYFIFILVSLLVVNAYFCLVYLRDSNFLQKKIYNCIHEWQTLKPLSIGPKLSLITYVIYIIFAMIYMLVTKNYHLFILLYVVPILSLPILLRFLPSVRKNETINKYFSKYISENEEFSFFYIMLLIATIWIGCIWGTESIADNFDRKITLTLQSITASIAPLAFYLAWKNYHRKSGVHIIMQIQTQTSFAYPTFISEIILSNEKDRSIIIKEIEIVLDNTHVLLLPIPKNSVIKAYDILTIQFSPYSCYLTSSRTAEHKSWRELLQNVTSLSIKTIQGQYTHKPPISYFNNFSEIIINTKLINEPDRIILVGHKEQYEFQISTNQYVTIIVPVPFQDIIILETHNNDTLWVYLYKDSSRQTAIVLKASFYKDLGLYIMEQERFQIPNIPHTGILDNLQNVYRNSVESFDQWKQGKSEIIDIDKIHLLKENSELKKNGNLYVN